MSEFCTLTPYALTMINSMRAMGYSFESALADIVDNDGSEIYKGNKINPYSVSLSFQPFAINNIFLGGA